MLIAFLIALGCLEIYSIAFAVFEYKKGTKSWWLCLIPFLSFYFLDKELRGFSLLTIKIKSLLVTAVIMNLIALAAALISRWGFATLPARSSEPLFQLMLVPICFASLIMWMALGKTTSDLLFLYKRSFKCDLLVSLLLVTIPFLIVFINPKEIKHES